MKLLAALCKWLRGMEERANELHAVCVRPTSTLNILLTWLTPPPLFRVLFMTGDSRRDPGG